MTERLLICTDLDRTLIPNGPQSEFPSARKYFAALAARPEITLAYVTGRHRRLVHKAITYYRLPLPDYVISDVGTTIYQASDPCNWSSISDWQTTIAADWAGHRQADIKAMLLGIPALRLQETARQNHYKLSYYVPLQAKRGALSQHIQQRLQDNGVAARLIWSTEEPTGIGLLDVVPASASQCRAIDALMQLRAFDAEQTVFCSDSGDDIELLVSGLPAVLVANCRPQLRKLATQLAHDKGHADRLYTARGGFLGMNGNYSAGILEGIAHFHPTTIDWMVPPSQEPQEQYR